VAYALNIDNLGAIADAVKLITTKHCGLQVLPEHYPIVATNLMKAVGEVLGAAVTPEIGAAWSKAVNCLAKILIDEEELLYQQMESRSGGFRGWKQFKVSAITQVSPDVKTFTFEPPADVTGPFDFTPGMYLSVKVDPIPGELTAPRHYTITSKPGENFLQCSVKKLDGGVVSTYLHDVLQEGMLVDISPPSGSFTMAEGTDGRVLISAGVGMTPMKAFLSALCTEGNAYGHCVKAVHVDKGESSVPFKTFFEANNVGKNTFYYSGNQSESRPDAAAIAATLVADVGLNNQFYLCGPPLFMHGIAKGLKNNKVSGDNIHWEAFGPQLSCPV
jgi:nitric oxide dioxygenase